MWALVTTLYRQHETALQQTSSGLRGTDNYSVSMTTRDYQLMHWLQPSQGRRQRQHRSQQRECSQA